MVTGSSERDGGTETAVIARDPNMNVTTFSMGEETMLECHYKFGIYEEQRREPRQTEPGEDPSTAQDFPETSSITSASSLGSDRKSRSNSIQFGFSNRKKKKKRYNEIIEPPPQTPPPPPSSSSPSSSSSSAFQHEPDDGDHVYVNTAAAVAEDRQEKARARWKFWKREESRAKINQPLSHTNNTGWVDY
ncbi:hypothetical protein ACHWQZ_G001613 [Mnemiopsis leidyi]